MVITHVAKLQNRIYSGVDCVVPMHVITQQKYADVCLYNLFDAEICGVNHYFKLKDYAFENLPFPYNKPDLVVIHEDYNVENLVISKYLRKNKIPYILVPHCELTIEAQKKKMLKKKLANFLFFNKLINGACAIQCLSQHELDTTCYGKCKFIGTNGIVIPQKKKVDFNQNKLVMTYIGRLDTYHKGLDLMIDAATIIKAKFSEQAVEIHIYGPNDDANCEKLKRRICMNKMDKYIFLHEAVSGEEKEKVLLNTDIFIQTSRFEGMPMGILEALSYGIPCLATEGTTLAECINEFDAGWGCDNDVKKLSVTMENCFKDINNLKEKSKNAIKLSSECFSWEKVSLNNINMYEKFIYRV